MIESLIQLVRTPQPDVLSEELRTETDAYLARRRGILGCSLLAASTMGFISLYQMGMISHLPEPPLSGLDADQVDASAEAYEWFSTPDGVLGLANYGVTGILAAMGGINRAKRSPWIPLALALKTVADALGAGKLTVDQLTKHRTFCSWCLLAAGATFTSAFLAFSEGKAALQELQERSWYCPYCP